MRRLLTSVACIAVSFGVMPSRANTNTIIGQEIPRFLLPAAYPGRPGLGSGSYFEGRPKLLNIFGSWCVPCMAEAPILAKLSQMGVAIDGVAVRDTPEGLQRFVTRFGNPFGRVGSDPMGEFVKRMTGLKKVPSTFVVDGRGVVREVFSGKLEKDDIPEILEALQKAR